MTKPSVDRILLRHAFDWSSESKCRRLQVGAVLASEGRSIATGYNGTPRGLPACLCGPESRCESAVHAELNALLYAGRLGVRTVGTTLYCTHNPCVGCSGAIINAGVVRVVYAQPYRDLSGLTMLEQAGIEVENLIDY
jgi:dCMP deaminase